MFHFLAGHTVDGRPIGGRTIFVGPVLSGGLRFVTGEAPRRCDLVLDGAVVGTVTLVGEFLPRAQERGVEPSRSVFTLDPVPLNSADLKGNNCRLVEHAA